MIEQLNKITNKLQDAWQRAFPTTISGNAIDLSKGSGVLASIKHIEKK